MAGLSAICSRALWLCSQYGNDGVVLDIVSACVVGGVSIYAGPDVCSGALFGAQLITVLSERHELVAYPYYLSLIVKGAVMSPSSRLRTKEGRREAAALLRMQDISKAMPSPGAKTCDARGARRRGDGRDGRQCAGNSTL